MRKLCSAGDSPSASRNFHLDPSTELVLLLSKHSVDCDYYHFDICRLNWHTFWHKSLSKFITTMICKGAKQKIIWSGFFEDLQSKKSWFFVIIISACTKENIETVKSKAPNFHISWICLKITVVCYHFHIWRLSNNCVCANLNTKFFSGLHWCRIYELGFSQLIRETVHMSVWYRLLWNTGLRKYCPIMFLVYSPELHIIKGKNWSDWTYGTAL